MGNNYGILHQVLRWYKYDYAGNCPQRANNVDSKRDQSHAPSESGQENLAISSTVGVMGRFPEIEPTNARTERYFISIFIPDRRCHEVRSSLIINMNIAFLKF